MTRTKESQVSFEHFKIPIKIKLIKTRALGKKRNNFLGNSQSGFSQIKNQSLEHERMKIIIKETLPSHNYKCSCKGKGERRQETDKRGKMISFQCGFCALLLMSCQSLVGSLEFPDRGLGPPKLRGTTACFPAELLVSHLCACPVALCPYVLQLCGGGHNRNATVMDLGREGV